MTSSSGHWTVPSAVRTNEYSSNGWKYGQASSFQFIDLDNQEYTSGYSIELNIHEMYTSDNSNPPFIVYFENSNQSRTYLTAFPNKLTIGSTTVNRTFIADETYRLEYEANKLSLYIEDTLIGTTSHNIGNAKIRLATGTSRYCTIKDFKIKPL